MSMPSSSASNRPDCPVCGSSDVVNKLTSNGFNVYDCRSCDLLFTFPLPSENYLNEYYQGFMYGDGRSGEKPSDKATNISLQKRFLELGSLLECGPSGVEGKSFLDYGGGTGSAFGAAKALGLKAYFFDLDDGAINHVKETYCVDDQFLLNDLSGCGPCFDVVFCDNVIEHVRKPDELIALLYSVLKPGGRLIVKTPNAKNFEVFLRLAIISSYFRSTLRDRGIAKALKSLLNPNWHCDPPRHLYSFTALNLTKMAENLGLEKDSLKYSYYESDFWQNTYAQNLQKRLSVCSAPQLPTMLLLFLLSIPELALNIVRKACLSLGIFKPAGLTMLIDKPRAD